jgi:hypothetical protein
MSTSAAQPAVIKIFNNEISNLFENLNNFCGRNFKVIGDEAFVDA